MVEPFETAVSKPASRTTVGCSDGFNDDSDRVFRQCLKVASVAGDNGPAWLGKSDHESVHSGSSPGQAAQLGGTPRECLGNLGDDVTCLEKPVGNGVASRVPLQAFDEHDG